MSLAELRELSDEIESVFPSVRERLTTLADSKLRYAILRSWAVCAIRVEQYQPKEAAQELNGVRHLLQSRGLPCEEEKQTLLFFHLRGWF